MIELYGVFYKLIATNYYNCLCCQLPDKPLLYQPEYQSLNVLIQFLKLEV